MKLRQRIFHFVVTAAAIWFALFAHSQTLSDFSPVSAWDLSKRAVPISERQTVNGDGYGGDGFTVLPLLKENETPCTAIIIHGLGGTGQEWGYLSLGLSFFSLNYVKFIIPSASNQSVTYLKTTMPSWFDIRSIRGRDADVDRADLLSSVGRINKIIDGEIRRGVPEKRIFVIGFSQGGALSLTTFLRSRRKLAGCVGVATWLPLDREYGSSGNVTVPAGKSDVLMIHGTKDKAVAVEYGEFSAKRIRDLGITVNFVKIPDAPHIILSEDVIKMIEDFITRRASGTTYFLRSVVRDLTETFGSWTENIRNNK